MFSNKLTYFLTIALLLVAGFIFLATPATAAVVPRLAVTDELKDVEPEDPSDPTYGIQVYGIRAEPVSFQLTVTFQEETGTNAVNTPVTGFKVDDIQLNAAGSNGRVVPSGATLSNFRSNADDSVYTMAITAKGGINTVRIAFVTGENGFAQTLGSFVGGVFQPGNTVDVPTDGGAIIVNIVRSAAPPLIVSPDKLIGGNAPFTVTLTSAKAITLRPADLKITGGSIDSLSPDAAKKVWTVTIRPGVNVTEVTVEAAENGLYIIPKGTFTVDTTGPIATITGTSPVGGGAFVVTITFDELLQTGATLLKSEIVVVGGSISDPIAIPVPNANAYVATLTPNPTATKVTVQVNAGAVADTGGIQNVATPSPARIFRVAATATPPTPTPTPTPTPGTDRDLTGIVTISEIMFATDGGSGEIQWIELFNSSKTETVALNAGTGWELVIENYNNPRAARAPLSGTINFKNNGSVKTIKPRQTVLIVSGNGRNSDRVHFTTTRVFKVYPTLADEFDMRSLRDPFLHPTQGFHIQLVDGSNELVDEVGNIDGRPRTADQPAWELPEGWTAAGDRTSIIRRYRGRDIAQDGTRSDGWIPAAETSFLDLSERNIETWYGSSSDQGSPGIRAGGALPVQLSQFRPDRTEAGAVLIHWTTQSEMDNAGFNILRSQTRTGEFKIINAQLIPGAGTTAESTTYTWTDTTAKPNLVYYYQIEDVSFAGERQTLATVRLRGVVSAKGKLTTQWGQLKRLPH